MVYPSNPPAAAGNQPPSTVKISTYLLWLVAAVSLIAAIIEISVVGRTTEAYRELNAGTPAEGTEGAIVAVGIVAVVISVLFAVGLAVLAIFNNRGRNGARITTWVIGGIALCCTGLGLAGTAVTGSMNLGETTGGPTPAEVERRLDEALPSWYDPATVTLTVISLLALLGAMILLALPASNAWFRKPAAAGWDPSLPYPYPGGQPPYPGGQQPPYPAPGQQSTYPSYPGPGQQPSYPSHPGQAPDPSTPPPPSTPPQSGPPQSAGPGPAGSTAAEPPGQSPPHTGSIPPTDPWDRPDDDRRPPSGPAT